MTDGVSGYVALAVATENGTETQEIETGHADREKNMIQFANGALHLLLTVLQKASQKL